MHRPHLRVHPDNYETDVVSTVPLTSPNGRLPPSFHRAVCGRDFPPVPGEVFTRPLPATFQWRIPPVRAGGVGTGELVAKGRSQHEPILVGPQRCGSGQLLTISANRGPDALAPASPSPASQPRQRRLDPSLINFGSLGRVSADGVGAMTAEHPVRLAHSGTACSQSPPMARYQQMSRSRPGVLRPMTARRVHGTARGDRAGRR